jgi:hypothetical protein
MRWPRSLSPDDRRELERLRAAGFAVEETPRHHLITLTGAMCRRYQLLRTVPHEVGHWVDYRKHVLDAWPPDTTPVRSDDAYVDLWLQRPHLEREQAADRYADRCEPTVRRYLAWRDSRMQPATPPPGQ